MSGLELKDVTVTRGGRDLLAQVSLQLRPGELTAILGPNGAGKTTFLSVAAGSLSPSSGSASLDGVPLPEWDGLALARRRGVLPQLSGLDFPFSVEEVVSLGRHPHGDSHTPTGQAAVERALALLELGPRRHALYPTLSGGERQRTHAARVLAQLDGVSGTPWLLLDEPTSALDLAHQHRLLARCRALVAEGTGVVAILHDPGLAARYADRWVVISAGRLVADGTPREVLAGGTLAAALDVHIDVLEPEGRDFPVVVASPRP